MSMKSLVAGAAALCLFAPAMALAGPPVELTAQEDHRRIMDLLGMETIRPGRNGLDPNAPNAANYDESKATPFPDLPDPLTMNDGQPVTAAQQWREARRPEIVEDFDREIYGRMPQEIPGVTWEVVSTKEEMVGEVPAIVRELAGHVDNSAYPHITVTIDAVITTPREAAGPVPGIIHLMFRWPAGRPRPPAPPGPTPREQVLAKGWAFIDYVPVSVQADNGAGLTQGIIGLVNKGQPRDLDDWGVLRAWGWGASRVLDFLESDDAVDGGRVVVEGLSRYGKAVLVTMADDPRFAIGFSGSSGAGGASLLRRDIGEIVENLAGSGEYHWMAGNFLKYAGPLNWGDLPVDAHQLVALSAPRPLYIGSGLPEQGDGWVDPKGMFLAAVAASPVYELLGAKGLSTDEFPPAETGLTDSDLAWRQHSGGHTNGPNWPDFLEYAARNFEAD